MSEVLLPIPEVPDGLREAAQLGTLVPFIGAGVSLSAGCRGWDDFADEALNSLVVLGKVNYSYIEQVRHLRPRVKLSLARSLESEHKISIDWTAALYASDPAKHVQGRRLYSNLFRLGRQFVTTNYDRWLDDYIHVPTSSVAPPAEPVRSSTTMAMGVVYKVEEFVPAALDKENTVVHLHGSLSEPSKMVLTTQDYVRHYANEPENRVLSFLEYLFNYHRVLFIGYGLEELEILEYVVQKSHPQPDAHTREARHYLLHGFYSHQEALRRALKSYFLNECGIELIPYLLDDKGYAQLVDVIEEFGRRVPVSTTSILQKMQNMGHLLNG